MPNFAVRSSASPQRSPRMARRAFTLLEMLLVLAVVAVLVALVWPSVRSGASSRRLREAARELQAEFARVRLEAVRTATDRQVRFEPGEGAYEVGDSAQTAFDPAEHFKGNHPSRATRHTAVATGRRAGESTRRDERPRGEHSSGTTEPADRRRSNPTCRLERLPEGITFHCPDMGSREIGITAKTARPRGADSRAAGDAHDFDIDELASAILFRADGTTSDARVVLEDDRGDSVVVSLRGLTGTAKVGPVLAAENRR